MARLKLSLLQIKPLNSLEEYESYANAHFQYYDEIIRIYENLCAS